MIFAEGNKDAFNNSSSFDSDEMSDKEIIEMLDFMDAYSASYRFRELKRENTNLKRKLTILNKKYNE